MTTRTPHSALARTGRRLIARGTALAAAAVLALPAAATADAGARPGADAPTPPTIADFAKASEALLQADVKGTAWHIDRKTQTLVLTADSTVDDQEIATLRDAVGGALGESLRVERAEGEFRPYVSGGDAILTEQVRCSLGFNVRKGGEHYFLTAGHCAANAGEWSGSSGTVLGPTVDSSFPGNDYGLVRYETSDVHHPGTVGSQDIRTAGEASVGQQVQRRGSTTGVHGGEVTGLDATVNYGDGDVVRGMIRTDVCAEPGDSGGPLYAGSTALGLTSGGSGDCEGGSATTFFQPVTEALEAYGVEVY